VDNVISSHNSQFREVHRLKLTHDEAAVGAKFDVYGCLIARWKLSEGNSDTVTQQRTSHDSPSVINADINCSTRSGQLAVIGSTARDIFSFIAAQPADEDLHQYVDCLELVSRGLVSGKIQRVVECLRRLMDEGSNVAETANTSSVTRTNGNVVLCIICPHHLHYW